MTSYEFYTETFCGSKIPQDVFDYVSARAEDFLTANFNTAGVDETTLNKAICACAEVYYSAATDTENISSEKVGDYSVTYASRSSQSMSLTDRMLEAAAIYFPTAGWC